MDVALCRPPLSAMTDRPTREAAGYRRPFVVHGRSAWFAFTPSGPSGQSYGVRGCPTWAEAYAWACAKADRCAVCGNPSSDHGGWNHAFTTGVKVATRDTPDSADGRFSRCASGCNDHTGHTYGPGCYQPERIVGSQPEPEPEPEHCPCNGVHFPDAKGCRWCRCHRP